MKQAPSKMKVREVTHQGRAVLTWFNGLACKPHNEMKGKSEERKENQKYGLTESG